MLYAILKIIVVFILKVFFRLEVKGKEFIPKNNGFIFASNHLSNLDPVVLGAASPVRIYFLAKEELFRNPLFSSFLKTLGAIPLKRDKPGVSSLKKAINILRDKKPIVIFPQGTRGYRGIPLEGVGFLCRKSRVPVIAAKITGTDKALPKGKITIKLHPIKVTFSSVEDLSYSDSYEKITQKVWKRIENI